MSQGEFEPAIRSTRAAADPRLRSRGHRDRDRKSMYLDTQAM
jgi:hypothetical protein